MHLSRRLSNAARYDSDRGAGPGRAPCPKPYWSAKETAARGVADPFSGGEAEAIEQLDALLRDAVRLRMIADVPLGAFLSGGIDSSTIVGLMQTQSTQPVKTYSIGFREDEYNEAGHAKAVAKHLGTDHTELYVTPAEAREVIPLLPAIYDEPFSDNSQIPTYLVCKLARRQVTVSLSGDGGDEVFGGYNRYFAANHLWKTVGWLPRRLSHFLGDCLTSLSPSVYDRFLGWLPPPCRRNRNVGDAVHLAAEFMKLATREYLYQHLMSAWQDPVSVVAGGHEPHTAFTDFHKPPSPQPLSRRERGRGEGAAGFWEKMMLLDTVTYLPDDIFTKVDRASMATSLEARVPLLDHRIVEFAWRLPLSFRIRKDQGKWILRAGPEQIRSSGTVRASENGFRRPHRQLVARTVARVGGMSSRRGPPAP